MRDKNIKILLIGDICGKVGRETVKRILPEVKKEFKPDLVIANADNIAHGKGATADTIKELLEAGVDQFTSGDHAFDRTENIDEVYGSSLPVVRPLNFSPNPPGLGFRTIKLRGSVILLANLIGRVFMRSDHECPFDAIDKLLLSIEKEKVSAIIIDIHAETTSEKIALKNHLAGRVSALIGTHTHIMTADQTIQNGTAYITDVGMTGFAEGVLGIGKEGVIKTFLTQIKQKHEIPEKGLGQFNAVLVEIAEDGNATKITPLEKKCNIN
jgi:2',3'-cyclic-nucleotide 2'-phosphodiesterase